MKKLVFSPLLFFAAFSMQACGEGFAPAHPEVSAQTGSGESGASSLGVNILVGDRVITATIEDNSAGRDFISRLPLDVTLNDFNHTTEKIFYPEPTLEIEGTERGCAPEPGDITIYEPWGNVAIFCKRWSYSTDLIKIGHIEGNGIEALRVNGNIRVRIELR